MTIFQRRGRAAQIMASIPFWVVRGALNIRFCCCWTGWLRSRQHHRGRKPHRYTFLDESEGWGTEAWRDLCWSGIR